MAYTRKTTGLGAVCVNLLIVDDDDTTVVDIGSAASTFTVHANVTIEDGTWSTYSPKAFETKQNGTFNFYGITFDSNKPVTKHGQTETGSGAFICGYPGANSGNNRYWIDATNAASFGINSSNEIVIERNGGVLAVTSGASLSDDLSTAYALGYNYEYDAANGEQIFFDTDGGTKSAWDIDQTSTTQGSDAQDWDGIGGDAGQGNAVIRAMCIANFSRQLTLTEMQDLRDDWWGELINEAAPGGGGGSAATGGILTSPIITNSFLVG